jgi:hypothetical protein
MSIPLIVTDVSGIFAWNVGASYRVTDDLLFGATYVGIDGSRKAGLGTFQSHDMIQLRATLQVN